MNVMTGRKEQIRPVSEAAEWVEKVNAGDLSDGDMEAFEAWLSDPQNEADYAICARVWTAAAEPEFWAGADTGAPTQESNPPARPGRHSYYWMAAAATVFLLVGAALFRMLVPGGQHYETAVGEQRLVVLADDSTILLNTNTSLDVRYSGKIRQVFLAGGEALFDVRRDLERPFEVRAEAGAIRVLGTTFAVRELEKGEIVLTVSEGQVAVTPKSEAGSLPPVSAGEMLKFDVTGVTSPKVSVNTEDLLQWRDGVVSFSGEPLAEVIREISRYTDRRITFTGEELARLRVSGVFRVGEVDSFLRGLAEVFPVSINTTDGNDILITAS